MSSEREQKMQQIVVDAKDSLRAAADLLEEPGAWIQCNLAEKQSRPGHMTMISDGDCWCAMGAIYKVAPDTVVANEAIELCNREVKRLVGRFDSNLVHWNDQMGRTQQEVVDLLRRAASHDS